MTTTQSESGQGNHVPRGRQSLIGRRWLACWIDFTLVWLIMKATELPELAPLADYPGALLSMIPAYFCVCEWRWGRTAGKWAVGVAVVNSSGGRPTLWQAVVRTLFRVLEVNPLAGGGILAGIVAGMSKREQRLGDMAAATYVVRRCRWR